MEEISNKSSFLRMKESLALSSKLLFVDKEGQYTANEAFGVYCGLLNQLHPIIKNGDVCLVAPLVKKETILIMAAIVSLGGVVLFGDLYVKPLDYLKLLQGLTNVDHILAFEDNKWLVKKENFEYFLKFKIETLNCDVNFVARKNVPSFYFLTSGSTGSRNLVALSEYSFVNHIVRELSDIGNEEKISYGCVPLNHVLGVCIYFQHLLTGHTIYVSESRNPDLALDIIEKYRCTAVANVPTFFYMLIEAQKKHPRDISSLKYGIIAGGGYSKEQFLNIEKELGISLCSSYGMTEASTVITNSPASRPVEERCVGVGKPFPGVDVVLKNDDGIINPKEGEICFKGYNLMLGYVKKGNIVLPVDADGYFHTGDIGTKDENGIYHVVGRKKNIIIRGGENLSPYVIEEKILSIDGIKDAVVVGIPSEKYGEVVAAYIASDVYKNTEEVEELLKKALQKNEMPYLLIIDDSIPLLSNGKHDRMRIRNIFISKDAHK